MRQSLVRSGSPSRAFESLYRRHADEIYRYSLAMLDRAADAEDATQTTFLNAYRALERGERPRDARRWLRAIALNVCREHYRRASRRPDEVSLEDDPGDLVLEPPTPALGDVIRGLSCLPFNQRAALVMREFEGRSLAEISAALEVSVSAVEALLFRGRRALREQLEGTLTCAEAERAISRQLDGALPRSERGQLRAHVRQCSDCASLARRLRGQRSAIRALALVPVPATLKLGNVAAGGGAAGASAPAGVSGGGPVLASLAGSVAAKVSVAAVVGAAALGVGYESLQHKAPRRPPPRHAASTTPRGPVSPRTRQAAAAPAARIAVAARMGVAAQIGRAGGAHAAGSAGGAHAAATATRRTLHRGAHVNASASLVANAPQGKARSGTHGTNHSSHGQQRQLAVGPPIQAHGPPATHAGNHQHQASRGIGRTRAKPPGANSGRSGKAPAAAGSSSTTEPSAPAASHKAKPASRSASHPPAKRSGMPTQPSHAAGNGNGGMGKGAG